MAAVRLSPPSSHHQSCPISQLLFKQQIECIKGFDLQRTALQSEHCGVFYGILNPTLGSPAEELRSQGSMDDDIHLQIAPSRLLGRPARRACRSTLHVYSAELVRQRNPFLNPYSCTGWLQTPECNANDHSAVRIRTSACPNSRNPRATTRFRDGIVSPICSF